MKFINTTFKMNYQNVFEFFIIYVLPVILLVIGLMGNIMGLNVLRLKKLKKIGPMIVLKYLFLVDSIYLLTIITRYMNISFDMGLNVISSLSCKLYRYIGYSLDAISPWLLAYISFDRLLTVKYLNKITLLRKSNFQYLFYLKFKLFYFNFNY